MDWFRTHTWLLKHTLNNSLPYQSFEAFINCRNLSAKPHFSSSQKQIWTASKFTDTENKISTTPLWFSLQDIFFTFICTLQLSFCSCCHLCYQNIFLFAVLSTKFPHHFQYIYLLPFPDSRMSSTVNPALVLDCTELWCDYHAGSLTIFPALPSVMSPSL